jgi:hypothetical protein
MNNDQLWKLLDSIQGQIRAFDTKAQVALGLDSLLAGLLGNEISKGLELSLWHFGVSAISLSVLVGLSLIFLSLSAFFAVMTVIPLLHLKQPKSHFFFCHLVELYGRKFDHAAKSLIALNSQQMAHELATQIQANAVICDSKSTRSRRALRLMTLSLVFYLFSIAPLGVLARQHATKTVAVPATSCAPAGPG